MATRAAFDAYVIVDWSACSRPTTGPDSVWWALLRARGGTRRLESGNCATRDALVLQLERELSGPLRGLRTLVGFDFPLGFPRGFAAALGYVGPPRHAWRAVWNRIAALVEDQPDNANNRLAAAAALNAAVSARFGPFYGRPLAVSPAVARTLSPRCRGHFTFPLRTRRGPLLDARRAADRSAGASSSPWFVYGGANSVGGQALLGIPRVRRLREHCPASRVWPFETGRGLPPRDAARVVFAEVYPSLFHVRDRAAPEIHDRLQVEATARGLAALDAEGLLAAAFAAPPDDVTVLYEEGWVLPAASQKA